MFALNREDGFFQYFRGSLAINPLPLRRSVVLDESATKGSEIDKKKIQGDFRRVGNDLRVAIEKYDEKI